MNKSVLLTRAKSVNLILEKKLSSHNFNLVKCSLIKYKILPFDESILKEYANIIVTSSFAANNLPVNINNIRYSWVVGNNTKNIMESKGYKVNLCSSNSSYLKQELEKNSDIKALYLSGNNITTEMPNNVKRLIFYITEYKKQLFPHEIYKIKNGIDYILLYSKQCAKTLIKLLEQNNLLKYLNNTTAVTISNKVAIVVKSYFTTVIACDNANQMIEFLQEQDKLYKSLNLK